MISEYALIVAGGSGSRMQSDIPKQFLLLEGKPVLMHTLEAFHRHSPILEIILVLPEGQFDFWSQLCRDHQFKIPHHMQRGGATRFHSVKNGLALIAKEGLVAIHDGVRPLVDVPLIKRGYEAAAIYGNAIAAVPSKDSLRQVKDFESKSVARSEFWLVQTPQTFRTGLIKEAYKTTESPLFTDDASVAEKAGHSIHLIEGSYSNLKITTPEDLVIAAALMQAVGGVQ